MCGINKSSEPAQKFLSVTRYKNAEDNYNIFLLTRTTTLTGNQVETLLQLREADQLVLHQRSPRRQADVKPQSTPFGRLQTVNPTLQVIRLSHSDRVPLEKSEWPNPGCLLRFISTEITFTKKGLPSEVDLFPRFYQKDHFLALLEPGSTAKIIVEINSSVFHRINAFSPLKWMV